MGSWSSPHSEHIVDRFLFSWKIEGLDARGCSSFGDTVGGREWVDNVFRRVWSHTEREMQKVKKVEEGEVWKMLDVDG